MSNGLGDFIKNIPGISAQDVQAFQTALSVIGAISAVGGYVSLAISVLKATGIIQQTDETAQLVNQLWAEFQAVLAGASEADLMRDVQNQIQAARTALQEMLQNAPDDATTDGPRWRENDRSTVDTTTLQVVNTLGGVDPSGGNPTPAYWVRPFFPELVYSDSWAGSLRPPPPPNAPADLAFDYRLTLAAFVESICIRLTILAAVIPNYETNAEVLAELHNIAAALEYYFETMRQGIVELRPPTVQELANIPDNDGTSAGYNFPWLIPGQEFFGAVDRYSTIHVVDRWPQYEQPNGGYAPGLYVGPPPDDYTPFLIRHLVRSMTRWKQVFKKVGLSVLAAYVIHLKALAGISPATVTGPNGDWSLRELAHRLATIPYSGLTNGNQPTSLKQVLQVLQSFNPQPYTSLRSALAQ